MSDDRPERRRWEQGERMKQPTLTDAEIRAALEVT